MDTLFLACFVFGALFTVVSVVLGAAQHGLPGLDAGGAHVGVEAGGSGADLGHGGDPSADAGHHGILGKFHLPLLNLSSILSFVTWFGAAGLITHRFLAWTAPLALAVAVGAGLAGAILFALFLARVMAGEREMDPRDYRLEGKVARVSVGIPAAGAGEITLSLAGTHRGETARSATGRPIPRGTEVAILEYERGVALVEPWEDVLAEPDRYPHGALPDPTPPNPPVQPPSKG